MKTLSKILMSVIPAIVLLTMLAARLPAAEYFVDQSHPKAADTNSGTEALPFKTISAAVAKVKPGDTVYVKNGTYREEVRRILEGEKWMQATERMTLMAAPNHRPVIKGSGVVTARFEPVRVALRKSAAGAAKVEYDPDAWRKEIGVDSAKQAQSAPVVAPPGAGEAADAKFVGIYVCPWQSYSSMAFVDETTLRQIGLQASPERAQKGEGFRLVKQWDGRDVADMRPGTFFYDAPAKKLYVWLADSGDPNKHIVEASVRGCGIELQGTWTVSGLDVTQCQDNFRTGGETALSIAGRRPILENCRILHNQLIGVIVHGFDGAMRGCEIAFNGVCGICPSLTWRMLIEKNDFHHNAWAGDFLCCGLGNKMCQVKDTRVIRNRFHDDFGGLWFDLNCNHTLVAENTFENCGCGIYFEISRWGVIVNNVFRNCGRGMWSYSSDVLIAHNIFDGCGEGVTLSGYPRGASYRQSYYDTAAAGWDVADCLMAVRNNLVVNNIIINSTGSYVANTPDDAYGMANFSDHNAFVWTYPQVHLGGNHIKFMAGWDTYYARLGFWQMERHYDEHSVIADPTLHNAFLDGKAWPNFSSDNLVGDPRFADRTNGDYRLRPDSPLRGKGITIPMVLNSTYAPAKDFEVNSRAWATTSTKAPAAKGRSVQGDVWNQKFYRIQPLPQVHRLVDLDEQGPADPGINYAWRATGKYPDFRLDGPPETAPDDLWVVNPTNRLKNGDFSKAVFDEMRLVDKSQKGLGDDWQVTAGKVICWSGIAIARPTGDDPAAPNTAAQKLGPIQPNTDYLLWADMKVDSHKEGYATTGRFYLAAGKDLTPIKSAEMKTAGNRQRHWNTFTVYYKSGADAKADPFVGKDLYVVFGAAAEGPKVPKNAEPVGSVYWDNFQLLTGEPLPAK